MNTNDALIFVFRSPNIPFWQFICLLSPGTPVQCRSGQPNIGHWCERQWRVRHVRHVWHVTMYMPGYVSGTAVSLFPQQSTAAATLLQQQQQQYLAALQQQQQIRSGLGRIYRDSYIIIFLVSVPGLNWFIEKKSDNTIQWLVCYTLNIFPHWISIFIPVTDCILVWRIQSNLSSPWLALIMSILSIICEKDGFIQDMIFNI